MIIKLGRTTSDHEELRVLYYLTIGVSHVLELCNIPKRNRKILCVHRQIDMRFPDCQWCIVKCIDAPTSWLNSLWNKSITSLLFVSDYTTTDHTTTDQTTTGKPFKQEVTLMVPQQKELFSHVSNFAFGKFL